VPEARRRGRPPLDATDPSVDVSTRLPSKQFDQLSTLAHRHRLTVAALTRRVLQQVLRKASTPSRSAGP
jgi:hypothetical protein